MSGKPTGAPDPRVGTVFHDKYEVLERLGAGGFGTVYRVRNLRLDTVEALKLIHRHIVLDEAHVDRFRQEAQLLRRLGMRSPYIPLVHDFDHDDEHGVWYFTLEFVPGMSVRDILLQEGALPVPRALALVRQVCAALAVAHGQERPVVHRDMKPDNIMVLDESGGDRVKILDFGIARILGDSGLTSTQGGVPGTAGFIAPEQLEGKPDPRTDLFATGVTLYQMLTARDPWLGKRTGDPSEPGEAHRILRRSLFGEPIPPRNVDPAIPERLEEIILRLLEKSPEDRFQSARELDGALAEVEAAVPASTRSVEPSPTGIAAVPGKGRAVGAVLVLSMLAVFAALVISADGEAGGLSPTELVGHLAAGEVEAASLGPGGRVTARFGDGSSGSVSWVGSDVGLQFLLHRIRQAGVPIEAAGEARLRILARRAGSPRGVHALLVSMGGERELCDPCPLDEEIGGPAGWYTARPAEGWTIDSALVHHESATGAEPSSPDMVHDRAVEIFLPAGLRTDLTLVLDSPDSLSPDSLALLLEAAEAAYRRGAWTSPPGANVVHYVDRILASRPGNRRALALRDSLARNFERLIQGALTAGDPDRARQIAERCLEAVPDAAPCREAAR